MTYQWDQWKHDAELNASSYSQVCLSVRTRPHRRPAALWLALVSAQLSPSLVLPTQQITVRSGLGPNSEQQPILTDRDRN